MKHKKWIRRIAILLVSLAVLTVILYFVVQHHAKKKVIAVIQEIVDGPVEVDEVRLRRDRVEVRGIRVYESESDKTAWLTIDEAAAWPDAR